MTSTVSFKEKFKSGFSLFKWELKSCIGTLTVFSILASTFIAITLTLSLVTGYTEAVSSGEFDYTQVQNALNVFQYVSGYLVFFLNAVFTIVYTIRIYSYLHNKRKADLYGSMPISRRTFYISKTVSAYILSVVPTLFFLGVISIISVMFGMPLAEDVAMLYVKLLLGAIACISFYGLLAVCCGTTLNSVLSFIAINFAYPIATLFIKGTIKAFFVGMPADRYNSSFIMKALNPMAAYDGTHIIYWLLFTALCLFLGIFLVKKRKAECAQTSFAYHLPCYVVEILVSFIIGMFLGTLFGSLNVMLYGYAGFIFGFVLGSVPAFIITHLILYKGFSMLWKSAIPCAAMAVTVIALVGFCNFDFLGYNSFVPAADQIKSAGLIDLGECYCSHTKGALGLARMAADDYDDIENIKTITEFHRDAVENTKAESNEKFASVWGDMLMSNIPSEYFADSYCVAYRLNNGRLIYRYYDPSSAGGLFDNYDFLNTTLAGKITGSDKYFKNYSAIMNADPNKIKSLDLQVFYTDKSTYASQDNIYISESENISAEKARADMIKVLEAYRKDAEELGTQFADADAKMTMVIRFEPEYNDNEGSLFKKMYSVIDGSYGEAHNATVYPGYTNTTAALKEIGVLNADGKIDHSSDYYSNSNPYFYG